MSNAGIWINQSKQRPGAYINFKANRKSNISSSERGVVALPLALGWGPSDTVIEISAAEVIDGTFTKKLACTIDNSVIQPLVEALKYAEKVLVYSLNSNGNKATAETDDGFIITAKYGGIRGNEITISVNENDDKYEVITMLRNIVQDRQTVATIEELQDNDFVSFKGTGELEANIGINLTGGTNDVINAQSYTGFFSVIKQKSFNVLGVPLYGVSGNSLNPTVVSFVKSLRDAGKKIQAVLNDYPGADYEGIISVDQGYITNTERVDVDAFIGTVAGMTAGAMINQSNTYRLISDAISIINPKTDEEIEKGLSQGLFMLSYRKDGNVVVESDINTLVNYKSDKNEYFRKNRVVRTLDDISTSIQTMFENNFIGKVTRNEAGKNAFKSVVIKYLTELQSMEAIQNFTNEDVEVVDGESIDSILVNLSIQPLDSMEKLYMTVTVN